MKKEHKIHSHAKLKKLPEEQRLLIIGWHDQDGYRTCLQRLEAELGIEVSRATLHRALAFWKVQNQFAAFEALARAQAEVEAEAKDGMTLEEMEAAVDRNFLAMASQSKDMRLYTEMRYLRLLEQKARAQIRMAAQRLEQAERKIAQRDRRLALQREMLDRADSERVLKTAQDPKMREILGLDISNAEKIALIRKAFFADIDAEEVVLPP